MATPPGDQPNLSLLPESVKDRAEPLYAVRLLLQHLWPKDAWGLRMRVVLALALLAGAKVSNIYVPIVFKLLVDTLTLQATAVAAVPIGLLIAYGLARVMTQVFAELRDAVFAKVGQRAIRSLALATFNHLHRLSLRFHLDRQTGGLSRIIERGTKSIEFLLFFVLFNIVPTVLEIVLVCGILWAFYGAWFAFVTFMTISLYIAYTLGVTEWRVKFRRKMNENDQEANTKSIDSLINYETVKYFNNERHEARRYDQALRRYEGAAVKSLTSLSLLNTGQAIIIAVGVTLMMATAAQGVVDGSMTVGDLVLINAYLIQLYIPLNFLGSIYRDIRQSLIDMEQMFQLLLVDLEISDREGAQSLRVGKGKVEFKDVSFGYDARRPILNGITFSVAPGRTAAIVGTSGAGKSTIMRLLFRFYDVTAGKIVIDGQDIRDVAQESLRAAIGIVPQDTVLFNDTIRYNIAYGRPGASQQEIEDTARLARIHDFVMSMPDRYETRVGERGLKLSGGEKQRVAIARTILKRPSILLFDEATSALDTRTEKDIQRSLLEVSANRTTIVIAHRLSTVVDADEILVLHDGVIVERGRHPELLASGGRYAAMWEAQQKSGIVQEVSGASVREAAVVGTN